MQLKPAGYNLSDSQAIAVQTVHLGLKDAPRASVEQEEKW